MWTESGRRWRVPTFRRQKIESVVCGLWSVVGGQWSVPRACVGMTLFSTAIAHPYLSAYGDRWPD